MISSFWQVRPINTAHFEFDKITKLVKKNKEALD